ncbi:DEKNAAC104834 [Brettanomyces naardenensis]|uniref:DEKNAAC104834 n=1 Tax=Brettanomyces naardenensis TaxID=13370 RepID=A0A448YRW7_BRENA|nr:DEKNAAC104834 [Brettanomyces naardenensis]
MSALPRRFRRLLWRVVPLALIIIVLIVFILNIPTSLKDSVISSATNVMDKIPWQSESKDIPDSLVDPSSVMTVEEIKDKLTFTGKSEFTWDQIMEQNYAQLSEIMNIKIDEPKVDNLRRGAENPDEYQRANATLMILSRNQDASSIILTIKQIEKHFNSKFHYPYVFLNDKEFSQRFIDRIKKHISSEAFFETIDPADWNQPDFIDKEKQIAGMQKMADENVAYAKKMSYHNMCRYYSKGFYNHPRMRQFKWYWRFEPGTQYYCDIDYDVFKFMEENNKTYGFTIGLYDIHQSVETLWPKTLEFVEMHPEFVNPNGAFSWLVNDLQNPGKAKYAHGYSTCHFWSNFEIGNMDFFRGEAYSQWIQFLDKTGGFYYERWGDAPVHSIGLSLFENRDKIHWFRDIGYTHSPYTNCPNSDKCSGCEVGKLNDDLKSENCLTNWWNLEMDQSARDMY